MKTVQGSPCAPSAREGDRAEAQTGNPTGLSRTRLRLPGEPKLQALRAMLGWQNAWRGRVTPVPWKATVACMPSWLPNHGMTR